MSTQEYTVFTEHTESAVLTAVLDYITASVEADGVLFAPITIGRLTKGEAISAEIVAETADTRYLGGNALIKTELLFLFRQETQRQALQTARAVQSAAEAAFGSEAAIHEALCGIAAQDLSYVGTDGANHIYALTVIITILKIREE
jgi:hypothetical protein